MNLFKNSYTKQTARGCTSQVSVSTAGTTALRGIAQLHDLGKATCVPSVVINWKMVIKLSAICKNYSPLASVVVADDVITNVGTSVNK